MNIGNTIRLLLCCTGLLLGSVAWADFQDGTAPHGLPPTHNAFPPINVGGSSQTKTGRLQVGSLSVGTNISTCGSITAPYGTLRRNGLQLEVCNSTGVWSPLSDASSVPSLSLNSLSDAATNSNSLFLGSNPTTLAGGNTAVGKSALLNATGGSNTAVGYEVLNRNTSGNQNTAVGYQALSRNITGSLNTAVGYQALLAHTAGNYNTALGYKSLLNKVTGANNTALGHRAGLNLTSGSNNIAIGENTNFNSSTGSRQLNIGNIIHGINSSDTKSGTGKIGVDQYCDENLANCVSSTNLGGGASAINDLSDAATNTDSLFLGSGTARGSTNTAVGKSALVSSNLSGGYNTALGSGVLRSNTSGQVNTASGQNALGSNTTGSSNTALGAGAGFHLTSGSYNIAIGRDTQLNNPTGSNQLNIGNIIHGINSSSTKSGTGKIGVNEYCDEGLASCITSADLLTLKGKGTGGGDDSDLLEGGKTKAKCRTDGGVPTEVSTGSATVWICKFSKTITARIKSSPGTNRSSDIFCPLGWSEPTAQSDKWATWTGCSVVFKNETLCSAPSYPWSKGSTPALINGVNGCIAPTIVEQTQTTKFGTVDLESEGGGEVCSRYRSEVGCY